MLLVADHIWENKALMGPMGQPRLIEEDYHAFLQLRGTHSTVVKLFSARLGRGITPKFDARWLPGSELTSDIR